MAGAEMSEMKRFEEDRLVAALSELPPALRVAFAAACAERLLPRYVDFANRFADGAAEALQASLGRLWDDLAGAPMPANELAEMTQRCMQLTEEKPDEAWSVLAAQAEDATAAVAYAIRCRLNGDPQEAAWAARRAYEAWDQYVIERDDVDISLDGAEARVLADVLVQAELSRQQADLTELRAAATSAAADVVSRLRARARRDGAFPDPTLTS